MPELAVEEVLGEATHSSLGRFQSRVEDHFASRNEAHYKEAAQARLGPIGRTEAADLRITAGDQLLYGGDALVRRCQKMTTSGYSGSSWQTEASISTPCTA